MKIISIFFVFLYCSSTFAEEKLSEVLSPISFGKPISSCYRWVKAYEYNKWISTKKPITTPILEGNTKHLGRGGEINKGIYCWHHPAGAVRGGNLEYYGNYLVRIDLKDDVVIYDRNKKIYYSPNDSFIPDEKKKGIDSEVFYANYLSNGSIWFQEYIIKDIKSIKGFTFNDKDLRESLEMGADEVFDGRLSIADAHFYVTAFCPFLTTSSDLSSRTYLTNEKRYLCEDTRRLLRKNFEFLRNKWSQDIEDTWYSNIDD